MFNYLLGSLSRIFTTLQEVDDTLLLYGFIAGFALNVILALQMLYYWKSPAQSKGQPRRQVVDKVSVAQGSGTAKSSGKSPTTRRRG